MQLRPASVPLITVDPYFSVWSPADSLTDAVTVHWTGSPNTIVGTAVVDGGEYRFLGKWNDADHSPALRQTGRDCDALNTVCTFEGAGISLKVTFTTPLLMDDLPLMTRPVSWCMAEIRSVDGQPHDVALKIAASEELCLNKRGEGSVETGFADGDGFVAATLSNAEQKVLWRSGDNVRIDWGTFYLAVDDGLVTSETVAVPFVPKQRGETAPDGFSEEMTFAVARKEFGQITEGNALFAFAYDDTASISYFGDHLTSVWNKDGKTIETALAEAYADYDAVKVRCDAFAKDLFYDAVKAGGEKYAEICEISYRQAVAAHKCVLDREGQVLFISKECFSNGCAVTVDVSYPSIPLFLLYNPELVRGMMRPIFRYARSDAWPFDFAPHDCGQYPLVHGQVYGGNDVNRQMPVEECGNLLVMAASSSVASGDVAFAAENLDLLESWVKYLEKHGDDPENQLCTDDFAGHLAHNCNLSLKAIMGITSLGIIYGMMGRGEDKARMFTEAREMAKNWAVRAANGDGSYRLAFDREGSWSMKYNIVWDKLFGTGVMDRGVIASEVMSYHRHINAYGLPLDNRADYTKSDWEVWTATLADDRAEWDMIVDALWRNYNVTPDRVPTTDWYDTSTAIHHHFQNRTVVGGHFMNMLEYSGKMKL